MRIFWDTNVLVQKTSSIHVLRDGVISKIVSSIIAHYRISVIT